MYINIEFNILNIEMKISNKETAEILSKVKNELRSNFVVGFIVPLLGLIIGIDLDDDFTFTIFLIFVIYN
jgi:hypothetical protein